MAVSFANQSGIATHFRVDRHLGVYYFLTMNSPSITPNLNILSVRMEAAIRVQRMALDGVREQSALLTKLIDQSVKISTTGNPTTIDILA